MSDNISILEVESPKQLKAFIKFPNKLYRNDPNYVAPLMVERQDFFNKKKNPFFRTSKTKMFLAKEGKEIVGRIATCINFHHNEFHGENTGFFGFFDCTDNYEVARKLLKVAMITLKAEGMELMRGPANFSTNHEVGFLIKGFDSPPVIMMTYNQPYLPKLAEKFGLKKVMDLNAYRLSTQVPVSERHMRVIERIKKRSKITLRPIKLSKLDEEIQTIRHIYNNAWEKNWGFVPLQEDEFNHIAKDMMQIADPNLILIAEVDGEPAGFSMSLPDINQALIKMNGRLLPFGILKLLWNTKVSNKMTNLRTLTLGVVHKYRKRGIDNLLYYETHLRGSKSGYQSSEISWILETNDLMCSAAVAMGAILYKRYRIVEMPI